MLWCTNIQHCSNGDFSSYVLIPVPLFNELFSTFLTSELYLNQLFHHFLFFHASALLSSGSTNPWPLQTGSMRVRGQTSIVCFPFISLHACILFLFFPLVVYHSLLFSPPVERHSIWTFLTSPAEPCSTYASTLDASLPPVFSSPPLRLPHLVLSVKLPLPVSHVLLPSSCCGLHLWSCSHQCSAYDVTTCFDHPVCLVSVSYSPPPLMFVR